ncbi:MAG: hypothetical protein RIM80_02435 [Alphaproteobacteria bacterium]
MEREKFDRSGRLPNMKDRNGFHDDMKRARADPALALQRRSFDVRSATAAGVMPRA